MALAFQAWKALVGSGKPILAFLFKLYNPEHFDFMMMVGWVGWLLKAFLFLMA
jgi:hypothetical protein